MNQKSSFIYNNKYNKPLHYNNHYDNSFDYRSNNIHKHYNHSTLVNDINYFKDNISPYSVIKPYNYYNWNEDDDYFVNRFEKPLINHNIYAKHGCKIFSKRDDNSTFKRKFIDLTNRNQYFYNDRDLYKPIHLPNRSQSVKDYFNNQSYSINKLPQIRIKSNIIPQKVVSISFSGNNENVNNKDQYINNKSMQPDRYIQRMHR